MKRSVSFFRSRRFSSFTLVELLVVIAIIAILAGVLFSAGSAAIAAAKRAKAANTATQIQTSVLNYYTEYSVYPVPSTTTTDYKLTDASSDGANWSALIYALSGNINPYNGSATPAPSVTSFSNTRAIAFLNLKSSDVDKANTLNAPLNPAQPNGGNPYFNIAIDSDYDGVLGTSPSAVTTMPNFASPTGTWQTGGGTTTSGVAVWANCNGNVTTQTNANFWVHTY